MYVTYTGCMLRIRAVCYVYVLYVTYTGCMLCKPAVCYIYTGCMLPIRGLYVTYTGYMLHIRAVCYVYGFLCEMHVPRVPVVTRSP